MTPDADERRSPRRLPQMKTFIVLVAALMSFTASAWAATPIPDGKWRFEFVDAKGRPDRPLDVYTYRPRRCDSRCPIVFLMHGARRDAGQYVRYWELLADRHEVIVVAPRFSQNHWPKAAEYNLGGMAGQADREKWAYSAIEHLFDEVRDGHNGYAIFGHSAGGQFVQRMALFRPDNRATAMVAANPGWYTMPEWRKDKAQDEFPYSMVGSPAGESELRRALQKRFVLLLGEKDDDPDDEGLNRGAGALKQGAGRVERGENFFKAATSAAAGLGVPLAWEMHEVPDTAHDGEAMSRIAAGILFGKK
jgi:poly(3-hydroxybutyrate) depolymerase